jgi:RNA polymerase sigma factor (sigma-70 family)
MALAMKMIYFVNLRSFLTDITGSMDINRFKLEVLPLKNKLYRFASRLLGDTDEAQDALQEVFIKLWNHREMLGTLNSLEAFAMKVTKNHCLDRIKARRTISLEQTGSLAFKADDQMEIETMVEMKDAVSNILKLIGVLPEQQRMIIQLRDIEGYEFEEIEDVLGISMNTIRVNLSRARKKIREMYLNSTNNGTEKSTRITG